MILLIKWARNSFIQMKIIQIIFITFTISLNNYCFEFALRF